jgi:hypothetical protein
VPQIRNPNRSEAEFTEGKSAIRNLFLPLLPSGQDPKAPTGKILGLKKQNLIILLNVSF